MKWGVLECAMSSKSPTEPAKGQSSAEADAMEAALVAEEKKQKKERRQQKEPAQK